MVVDIDEDDIIIAVMGPTGSGKSTFVQAVTGNSDVRIGHGLRSETEEICFYRTSIDGRSFVVVDTPGFDDINRSDPDILQQLAAWLSMTYQHNMLLSGIIYMHRIMDPKMRGSTLRNLRYFKALLGPKPLNHLLVVTTFWDSTDVQIATEREGQLRNFLEDAYHQPISMGRSDGSSIRARELVIQLGKQARWKLRIQEELVDEGRALAETSVGQVMQSEMETEKAQFQGELEKLQMEMAKAIAQKDQEFAELLRLEQEDLITKRDRIDAQIQSLLKYQQDQRNEQIALLRDQHAQQLRLLKEQHQDGMRRMAETFDVRLSTLEEQTSLPPPPPYAVPQPIDGNDGHQSRDIDTNSIERNLGVIQHLTEIIQGLIRRLLRPRLRSGFRRIEWICTCGEELFADFKEAYPASLDSFEAELQRSNGDGQRRQNTSEKPTSSTSSTAVGGNSHQSASGAGPSAGHGRNPTPGDGRNDSPSAGSSLNSPHVPIATTQNLGLCVKSGKFTLKLSEIGLNETESDGVLFRRIREEYLSRKSDLVPLWARFSQPYAGVFVRFRLDVNKHVYPMVGSLTAPAIPPKSEVEARRYSYQPCPIDEPPVPHTAFMHLFLYGDASKHPLAQWGPRLPRKVGDPFAVSGQSLALGWGVEIQERPHWAMFTASMFLVLLLSGLVAGIYSWRTGDHQSGIAIGTWLTSTQAMAVATLFFWWT